MILASLCQHPCIAKFLNGINYFVVNIYILLSWWWYFRSIPSFSVISKYRCQYVCKDVCQRYRQAKYYQEENLLHANRSVLTRLRKHTKVFQCILPQRSTKSQLSCLFTNNLRLSLATTFRSSVNLIFSQRLFPLYILSHALVSLSSVDALAHTHTHRCSFVYSPLRVGIAEGQLGVFYLSGFHAASCGFPQCEIRFLQFGFFSTFCTSFRLHIAFNTIIVFFGLSLWDMWWFLAARRFAFALFVLLCNLLLHRKEISCGFTGKRILFRLRNCFLLLLPIGSHKGYLFD